MNKPHLAFIDALKEPHLFNTGVSIIHAAVAFRMSAGLQFQDEPICRQISFKQTITLELLITLK